LLSTRLSASGSAHLRAEVGAGGAWRATTTFFHPPGLARRTDLGAARKDERVTQIRFIAKARAGT